MCHRHKIFYICSAANVQIIISIVQIEVKNSHLRLFRSGLLRFARNDAKRAGSGRQPYARFAPFSAETTLSAPLSRIFATFAEQRANQTLQGYANKTASHLIWVMKMRLRSGAPRATTGGLHAPRR
jgi:hypothetical protein